MERLCFTCGASATTFVASIHATKKRREVRIVWDIETMSNPDAFSEDQFFCAWCTRDRLTGLWGMYVPGI